MIMKNELLDELWAAKDQIAKEAKFDIDNLANNLKKIQKTHKVKVFDFSKEKIRAA